MKKLPDCHPDTPSMDELRGAFGALQADRSPRWGTMDAARMVRHCRRFIDLYLGKERVSLPIRVMARLLGGLFLRKVLAGSPRETPRNLSTLPVLRVPPGDALELEKERDQLLAAFQAIDELDGVVAHPLYGSMHAEDVRALVRHHSAHHANQFGLLGEQA